MNNKYFNNLYSIDFETFGLNPSMDLDSGGIWSIGVASHDKKVQRELFIKQNSGMGPVRTIKALRESSAFNESQFQKGHFMDYQSALKARKTMSSAEAVSKMFNQISPDGAILIQNVNFEQKFLKAVLQNMDPAEAQKIKDSFMFRQTLDTNEVLHRPPSITNAHVAARESFANFRNTQDVELKNKYFESTRKQYRGMIQEYRNLLQSKAGSGRFVIELQDITEALYTEAAAQGHLDKNMILSGRRVSFLTDVLLEQTEKHTALSDANQQNEVFAKMMKMHEELVSDKPLSQTSKDLLAAIRERQPAAALQEFISSVTRARTDINTTGSTRINLAMLDRHSLITMEGPFGQETAKVRQYRYINPETEGMFNTRDISRALADVKARFQGIVPEKIMDNIINNPDAPDVARVVAEAASFEAEEKIAISKMAAQAAEEASVTIEERAVKGIANKMSSGMVKGGLAVLGAAGLYLGATSSSSEDIEQKKRMHERRRDSDVQRARFSDEPPIIYHGTGLQNYKERNKHHQY